MSETQPNVPPSAVTSEASSVRPPRRKAGLVFGGLLGAALLIGGGYAIFAYGTETTDNAQIEGHVLQVAARIGGQVLAVHAEENQRVKKGDVLVELDPDELAAKLQAAKGDQEAAEAAVQSATSNLELTTTNADTGLLQAEGGLVQAESSRSSTEASLAQAKADRDAAVARWDLAQAEYKRTMQLAADGAAAPAEVDLRTSQYAQAKAQLAQAKAHYANVQAGLRGAGGTIATAKAKVVQAKAGPQQIALAQAALAQAKAHLTQAQAAYKLAELNLSYTQVRAPFDGFVAKRSVEAGQLVGPEKPLFALVGTSDIWLVANFKEDQLASMRPGQPVEITVDAFGRKHFHGEIDSLADATGARFSLLPPDNASGNFIKVTQRVPVRIRFTEAYAEELRIGMSADVKVDTAKPGRPAAAPSAAAIVVGQK